MAEAVGQVSVGGQLAVAAGPIPPQRTANRRSIHGPTDPTDGQMTVSRRCPPIQSRFVRTETRENGFFVCPICHSVCSHQVPDQAGAQNAPCIRSHNVVPQSVSLKSRNCAPISRRGRCLHSLPLVLPLRMCCCHSIPNGRRF